MSPEVLAAMIEGGCNMVATIVPTCIAYVLTRRWMVVKQARETTLAALREIVYLREVITQHERITGVKSKGARQAANANGVSSTERFYPAALQRKIASYERLADESLPLE